MLFVDVVDVVDVIDVVLNEPSRRSRRLIKILALLVCRLIPIDLVNLLLETTTNSPLLKQSMVEHGT
jgi:hypothetical protein